MAPTLRQNTKAVQVIDEDSMDVDEPEVRLKTSDGKRFILTKSEASCSNALRMMIESSQNTSTEYVNLPSVHSKMLSKIIEWCQFHCNDRQPQNDNTDATYARDQEIVLTAWDRGFFGSMSDVELLKLLHVASFLDVRTLFNAGCHIIGKQWEGKRVDEIRKMYNLKNDFTPEEESQMLKDTKALGMND